jgi:hypothetical protein
MSNVKSNIPDYTIPFIDATGRINEIWWRFLVTIFNRTGGTAGGDIADLIITVNAQGIRIQFLEAEQINFPLPIDVSRPIDELRNEIAFARTDGQELRRAYDELILSFNGLRNISDLRSKIDDLESFIAAFRPLPIFPTLEQFIAPTLLNSWTNFGGGYNPAGFYKDPFGIVHLRGVVQTGAPPYIIFRLPSGYLPANQEMFSVTANNAFGRVDVLTTGDVQFQAGNNTFVSLDGMTFRASK